MQQENPGGQNACPLCNMKFKSKDILDKHIQRHSEKNSVTCEVCNKIYSNKYYLSTHMKYHSEENPFKCEECDLRFADKCQLQRHWRVHIRKKPYTCELCNKTLSTSRSLQDHRLTHTGEKPYWCEICNKSFVSSRKLSRHLKTFHENKKPLSFQICEDFLSSDVDSDRYRIHSENCKKCKNPYVCDICNRRCKTHVILANHKHFHEKKENKSMETEAAAVCSENSAEEAATYSQFMRTNSNTYGKRNKNVATEDA